MQNINKIEQAIELCDKYFASDDERACIGMDSIQDVIWYNNGMNNDSYLTYDDFKQVVANKDWELKILERFADLPVCDTSIPDGLVIFRDQATYDDYMTVPDNYTQYTSVKASPFWEDDEVYNAINTPDHLLDPEKT